MRTSYWVATAVASLSIAATSAGPAFAAPAGGGAAADSSYLKTAHQSNLAEIATSQDAERHATTGCVKKVAAILVRDHMRLDESTKALAGKLGVAPPASPNAMQKQQLKNLQAKANTSAYDSAWLAAQEKAHKKTLALLDEEIHSGHNEKAKASARAARPVIVMHLNMVRGGTCHAPGSMHVPAGTGGQAASAAHSSKAMPAAMLGGGALMTALGAGWARRARRSTARR